MRTFSEYHVSGPEISYGRVTFPGHLRGVTALAERSRSSVSVSDLLKAVEHRPETLPQQDWAIRMSWTDLLFAHWPVPLDMLQPLVPERLEVERFDGSAWVGVVPFRMEQVQLRGLPALRGTSLFAEANVRTYVRDRKTGARGVYFFSLDASNPLAVLAARLWYRLPYYLAQMQIKRAQLGGRAGLQYSSSRLFGPKPAVLRVSYGAIDNGQEPVRSKAGTLQHFLTERYALFTHAGKRLIRARVHHFPWLLQPAEAEFQALTLASAQAIKLPAEKPLLHYSRHLDVLAWRPEYLS